MRFIDLFAGLGGFHSALSELGHKCVFASEIDAELRDLYAGNHPDLDPEHIVGDITREENKAKIPRHEILCAGFPCQPFSKSGTQKGFLDATRGTLFHEILEIAAQHKPDLILLENVGNFSRHDGGNTWRIVRESLEELGYDVRGTEPKVSGGHGLISPHHFGHPHHRERFFIVAASWDLPEDPFPSANDSKLLPLDDFLDGSGDLTTQEQRETALSSDQLKVIEHWNEFVSDIPPQVRLPSFPIWSDEFGSVYPFEDRTPNSLTRGELAEVIEGADPTLTREELLQLLPSYAKTGNGRFPKWKRTFIRKNRQWYEQHRPRIHDGWLSATREFPASLRKFEWNCKGEERDFWSHLLQFRPSGLRISRFRTIPALVAMTTTQIPVLGPYRRFLSRREGLRLQGFDPERIKLPESHVNAFRALGNAVHVAVVKRIAASALRTLEEYAPNGNEH